LAPQRGFHHRLEGRINQELSQGSQASQGSVVAMRPSRRAVLAWALIRRRSRALGLRVILQEAIRVARLPSPGSREFTGNRTCGRI
jgi:glutamate/tyrosine decarboxylase-like PLP-dependent enzyme